MRISDWSSDVCSSDLGEQSAEHHRLHFLEAGQRRWRGVLDRGNGVADHRLRHFIDLRGDEAEFAGSKLRHLLNLRPETADAVNQMLGATCHELDLQRSEEHTSELQSLIRISYAVSFLKKQQG